MEHHPAIFQIPNFLGVIGISGDWVPEHVTMAWLVMAILIGISCLATRRLEAVPGPIQNFMEVVVETFGDLLTQMIGPTGKRYLPLIGTAGLFILVGNLLGMFPGLKPPTANLNTTAALAIIIFLSYNYFGIREQGVVAYLRHFCGPILWLAPIMFPIELIGHLARPISLSIRLFGNIFGEESVIVILLSLIWLGIPYVIYLGIMMPLSLFTSFVQAFIFVMLSMVYIAGAVHVEHEEHH
jgi:F-type H+-transporting ATPase subunit a